MKRRIFAAIVFILARPVFAADAYFLRFAATSSPSGGIRWADDILFYNTNPEAVTVRFVGVSNGTPHADVPDLVLPPHKTVSVATLNPSLVELWAPAFPVPPLWVLHLDVPGGVIAESRDAFYRIEQIPGVGLASASPRGKVSMPIVRDLAPPNVPQVHLGADLGGPDSRINVTVYNAASAPAVATIEVRRTCDDTVVATRSVTLAANSATQIVGVAAATPSMQCAGTATAPWVYTVTATVDQPSFTLVSNVAGAQQQTADEAGIFPLVTLAVTKNERF